MPPKLYPKFQWVILSKCFQAWLKSRACNALCLIFPPKVTLSALIPIAEKFTHTYNTALDLYMYLYIYMFIYIYMDVPVCISFSPFESVESGNTTYALVKLNFNIIKSKLCCLFTWHIPIETFNRKEMRNYHKNQASLSDVIKILC